MEAVFIPGLTLGQPLLFVSKAKEARSIPVGSGNRKGDFGKAVIGLAVPGKPVWHHHHPLRLSIPLPNQDCSGRKFGPLLIEADQPRRHCRTGFLRTGTTQQLSPMADDIKYAPCILCARVNAHKVLARQDRGSEEGSDMYYFLACAGCGAVSMANIYNYGGDDEARYYPSPISRKPPGWLLEVRF